MLHRIFYLLLTDLGSLTSILRSDFYGSSSLGDTGTLSRSIIQVSFFAMASSKRTCENNPNRLCHICGEYTFQNVCLNVSDFAKNAYMGYFQRTLEINKAWMPNIVCKTCLESWRSWKIERDDCCFLWFGVNRRTTRTKPADKNVKMN